jgi:hypothetical protein
MKRLVLFLVVLAAAAALYAQDRLIEFSVGSGTWNESGGRLYQNDEGARLAKINIPAPQEGPMYYEFNARYETGGEDGHGGFGIHVFADRKIDTASWGAGQSYLLWLNYDENPLDAKIPVGLSAQIYRSYTNSYMELIDSIDMNEYVEDVYEEDLEYPVPFKILVDGSTGEVRVYDPRDPDLQDYFFYTIKDSNPLKGDWVALRTNGVRLSFAPGLD